MADEQNPYLALSLSLLPSKLAFGLEKAVPKEFHLFHFNGTGGSQEPQAPSMTPSLPAVIRERTFQKKNQGGVC